MKVTRRSFLKLGMAAGASAVFSGFPNVLRGAEPKEILFGSIEPASGPVADIGIGNRRAQQLAVEEINEAGGIKSLGGAKVKLLLTDSEFKPAVARSQAEKLIREGVVGLIGPFSSADAMAIATLAEQRRIPFVIDVAAADVITQKGYKYTFRVFPRGSVFGVKACHYVMQILNEKGLSPKRAVVLNQGDLFGKAQSGSFLNAHKALKDELKIPFEIVDHVVYPMGAQDLSAEIARVKSAKPDILFPVARPGDARLTIRELYKQRVELLGIISPGSPGWYEPEFIEDMGKLADYVLDNVPWYDPKSPIYQRVGKKYSSLYPGKYIDTNNGYAYTAVRVLADAIERAASTETEALVAALRDTNLMETPMIGAPVAFDENGDNINATSAMVQVLAGKVLVVLPKESSEADYVFPVPQLWERGV